MAYIRDHRCLSRMNASCNVRNVSEIATAIADTVDPGLPPAPGAEHYPALDLANSAIALPGGQFLDSLGTPSGANQWLVDHDLVPADAGMQEICAARLRSLREQVRALLASRVGGHPAPATALAAVNDALTRVPPSPRLAGMWSAACTAPPRTPSTRSSTRPSASSPPTPLACSPGPTPNG
ncbi:hypothetical protein GCM10009837_03900 [Streptomyces durmitorensis]